MRRDDTAYYGKMILFILAMLVGVFLLSGCKTSCVPMEKIVCRDVVKHRTDTLLRTDSVWLKDSVIVTQRGDTVFHDRWHTQLKYYYINKVRTDTLIQRDTVKVTAPAGKEKTDFITVKIGKYSFVTLVLGLMWFLVWMIKRSRLWRQQ